MTGYHAVGNGKALSSHVQLRRCSPQTGGPSTNEAKYAQPFHPNCDCRDGSHGGTLQGARTKAYSKRDRRIEGLASTVCREGLDGTIARAIDSGRAGTRRRVSVDGESWKNHVETDSGRLRARGQFIYVSLWKGLLRYGPTLSATRPDRSHEQVAGSVLGEDNVGRVRATKERIERLIVLKIAEG
jgi:hypothetical protein